LIRFSSSVTSFLASSRSLLAYWTSAFLADQALAQMAPQQLPEDVGIATLPAPNMTMAAEGGIMGY